MFGAAAACSRRLGGLIHDARVGRDGGSATGAPGPEEPDQPSDQEDHGVTSSLGERDSSGFPLEPTDADKGECDDVSDGGQQELDVAAVPGGKV